MPRGTGSATIPGRIRSRSGERREADIAEFEIGRTQAAMQGLIHPHRYFRPFGGGGNLDRRLMSGPVVEYLKRGGYTCVLWNSIPRDWADPDGWVDRAMAHCRVATLDADGAARSADRRDGASDRAFLIRWAKRAGASARIFRPTALPIVDGKIVRPIDDYVAAA